MAVKILAGLSNQKLACHLALQLGVAYVESNTTSFADSETRVQITEDVYQCDVIIVQSTTKPTNDRLIELLLLIDATKRTGAKTITTVLPYFGYSRQDRQYCPYTPVSSDLVAKLLEAAGSDIVVTIDLHSKSIEKSFSIPIINLDIMSLLIPIIMNYSAPEVIVFPDIGGFARTAKSISKVSNIPIVVIDKSRDQNDKPQMSKMIGDVAGKRCLVVDDIIDSGETLHKAANLLIKQGALSVDVFVTHPVLSNSAAELMQTSCIDTLYVTDTIENNNLPSKFHVLSVAPIIITALQQLKIL